jgi:hypothetical protein
VIILFFLFSFPCLLDHNPPFMTPQEDVNLLTSLLETGIPYQQRCLISGKKYVMLFVKMKCKKDREKNLMTQQVTAVK